MPGPTNPMDENCEAMIDGKIARREGRGQNDGPYPTGSFIDWCWRHGWKVENMRLKREMREQGDDEMPGGDIMRRAAG